MKRRLFALVVLGMAGLSLSASAQDLSVRGGFSGNWYNPDNDHQGLQIEVIDPRRAVVAWYTYDDAGEPVWLFGVGDIRGNTIEAPLDSYGGGRFPTASDPGTVNIEPWGMAEIEFADCSSAELRWETDSAGFEDGSLPLTRLSGIEGKRCGEAEAFQRTTDFSFEQGAGPWTAVFADFTEGTEDSIMPESGWIELPAPLADHNGFMLAGSNAPDDLAMFLKSPLAGLQPETKYRVELEMTFATKVPRGCTVGIGGSPGTSVGVKLGASGTEPEVVENDGNFRLNIDKGGGPIGGGDDALVVGDMTNFQEGCPPIPDRIWQLKTVSTRGEEFTATTDPDGTLWIYGGSDSGFEGRTTFFVTDFTARLAPVSP